MLIAGSKQYESWQAIKNSIMHVKWMVQDIMNLSVTLVVYRLKRYDFDKYSMLTRYRSMDMTIVKNMTSIQTNTKFIINLQALSKAKGSREIIILRNQ